MAQDKPTRPQERWAHLRFAVIGELLAAPPPRGKLKEAIERLAASHDPSIVIGVGRVYVKQTALIKARALLAEQGRAAGLGREWNAQQPEWQAAERQLMGEVDLAIGSEIEDPAWFRAAWGAQAAAVLNAEEADESRRDAAERDAELRHFTCLLRRMLRCGRPAPFP